MGIKKSDVNLTDLFGRDRAQEDNNLKYYFVKTTQYSEIQNGEKELVLGRKGSGKSAMFTMLAEDAAKDSDTIPVKISFNGEDFIYIERWLSQHNFNEELNDDWKYSLAWKDFILSELIYSCINTDFFDYLEPSLKQKMIDEGFIDDSAWKRFAKSLLKTFKGEVQGKIGKYSFDFSNLTDFSSTDKKQLQDALDNLISNNNFFVVIDNLDEPWKNNNSMNAWLRGLVFSIRQLKREYKNIKIVAFLRTDIYDIISKGSDLFDSKNEITTISWDDNNYFCLKQLVAARIAHYFNKDYPTTFKAINTLWAYLFPVTYTYNHKSNYVLDYIITRTFQRPRELLQFCRLLIETSKASYFPLSENIISPAEIRYSNWKLNDISGEYSQTCKNIDKCIMTFVGPRQSWSWTAQQLLLHLESIDAQDTLIDAVTSAPYTTKESLTFLYRIGFLRKVISCPGKRTRYRMYYEDSTINYTKSIFDIHPAFRKKFTTF